jgi:hypothetical protein
MQYHSVIKSRRIRWAGHVARRRRGEVHVGSWCRNMEERSHLEDFGIDESIMLRRIFKQWDGRHLLDLSGSR